MTWKSIYPYDCVQYNAVSRRSFEDLSCLLRHYDKHHAPSSSTTLSYTRRSLHWLLSPIAALLAESYMDWEFTLQHKLPLVSWHWIAAAISLSAIIMMVGRLTMYNQPPWHIRNWIAVWNALWCFVTGMGCLRLAPLVWHNYRHYSIRDNVCDSAASLWMSGTTGLWATLWIYFKLVEVIMESILVVVLKQPCGLVQWFHNYAYVLVHGWHLVTSEIPGGSAVIAVYYGIVSFMNAYCFYLNVCQLPQPTKPTALLDAIHLVQTLSGVVLSVVTLQYWKRAVWQQHPDEICHANERHIRLLAFAWSGGHVLVAGLQALVQKIVAYDRQLRLLERKKRLQLQQHRAEKQRRLAAAKAVASRQGQDGHVTAGTMTTHTTKTKKKKKIMVMAPARTLPNTMKQIPEADYEESVPELMRETNNNNCNGNGPNGNGCAASSAMETAASVTNKDDSKNNGADNNHNTATATSSSSNMDSTVTAVTSNATPINNTKKKKKRKKKKKSSSSASASSSVTSQTPDDSEATDYSQATADSSRHFQDADSATFATATLSPLQGQGVPDEEVWVKPKSSKTIRKRRTNHIKKD